MPDSKRAKIYYLLFMLLCVPLYGYVPFVYGEVSSTAFVMLTAWMVLDCLDQFSWIKAAIAGAAMGIAVLLRQNTLICFIAFLIVVAIKLTANLSWKTGIIGVSLVLGVVAGKAAVNGIYAPVIPADSKPLPSILYVAMGTNDAKSGWIDGYHIQTFEAYGYDPAEAGRQGCKDPEVFWEQCKNDPGHAVDFYYRKMNTQWNAPMYQCLAMNNKIVGPQSPLAENVYYGELRYKVQNFMNIYQLLTYGGVLYLLAANIKRWNHIENSILLIGIFGGFLFTLIWEAKARYVLPYFIMMMPYAAMGISGIVEKIDGKLDMIKEKRRKPSGI